MSNAATNNVALVNTVLTVPKIVVNVSLCAVIRLVMEMKIVPTARLTVANAPILVEINNVAREKIVATVQTIVANAPTNVVTKFAVVLKIVKNVLLTVVNVRQLVAINNVKRTKAVSTAREIAVNAKKIPPPNLVPPVVAKPLPKVERADVNVSSIFGLSKDVIYLGYGY